MMRYILKKEITLVLRDIRAMVVLFVMPALLILIMSIAMQGAFEAEKPSSIQVMINNYSHNQIVQNFINDLQTMKVFSVIQGRSRPVTAGTGNVAQAGRAFQFTLIFDKDDAAQNGELNLPRMQLVVDPSVGPQTLALFQQTVRSLLLKHKMLILQKQLPSFTQKIFEDMRTPLPEPHYAGSTGIPMKKPTAAQQNVPAWLVFSMFFISFPISTIFINEKLQGTLARLKSMNVPYTMLMTGKILPYFLINQVQMILMLLVGFYLVPLLGGTALTIAGSYVGLLIMSASISLAAITFALLVGTYANTTEEASTMGGLANIIMAALGGIMVPTFIMPGFMQSLSLLSPMSWGLQGMLDIILRGGSAFSIVPEAGMLLIFSGICLTGAISRLHAKTDI